MTATWEIRQGDALSVLQTMEAGSVQCCVTSPPYFGLRDYGSATWDGGDAACGHLRPALGGTGRETLVGTTAEGNGTRRQQYGAICGKCGARRIDDQIGLEQTPSEYVAKLVAVFAEVRRVLRDDGVLWLVIGNSYAGSGKGAWAVKNVQKEVYVPDVGELPTRPIPGFPAKCLIPVSWLLGLALIEDGWILRNDAIWAKTAPMPSSVTDRLTVSHEYVLLFAKRERYYWDAAAIAEPVTRYGRVIPTWDERKAKGEPIRRGDPGLSGHVTRTDGIGGDGTTRNKRTVWILGPEPLSTLTEYDDGTGAQFDHFAAFPTKLVEPCILAGSRAGDTVLDPFAGSGTTGIVALRHGRSFVGIELTPAYVALARKRITDDAPMFNALAEAGA